MNCNRQSILRRRACISSKRFSQHRHGNSMLRPINLVVLFLIGADFQSTMSVITAATSGMLQPGCRPIQNGCAIVEIREAKSLWEGAGDVSVERSEQWQGKRRSRQSCWSSAMQIRVSGYLQLPSLWTACLDRIVLIMWIRSSERAALGPQPT